MNFTTPVPIAKGSLPIDYNSRIFSLGSCFAVNMAEKFDYFKFQNSANPFGILFHPVALEKLIGFAVNQKAFAEPDVFFHNERWHSFDAHSDLSRADKNELLDNLNQAVQTAHQQIKKATHLIITLGTAWVYKNIESDEFVANCHKVPQKQFSKALLSVDQIGESLKNSIGLLKKENPDLQIIFTVSPVRHIKDGLVENQWSKANLIAALHQTVNQNSSFVDYFPSYEIMMDELRDYRFYNPDMLHPNQTAIDYIWEKFSESWISTEAHATMTEINGIRKSLAHKPFHADSQQHSEFLQKLKSRINLLQSGHSHISF